MFFSVLTARHGTSERQSSTTNNYNIHLNSLYFRSDNDLLSDILGSMTHEDWNFTCREAIKKWRLPRNSRKIPIFVLHKLKNENKKKSLEVRYYRRINVKPTNAVQLQQPEGRLSVVYVFLWHFRGILFVLVINCHRMDLTANLPVTLEE